MKHKLLVLIPTFIIILTPILFAQINIQQTPGGSFQTGSGPNQNEMLSNLPLSCSLRTACLPTQISLFQLHQNTNSHISTDGSYNLNVCCSSNRFTIGSQCTGGSQTSGNYFIRVLGINGQSGSNPNTFTNAHVEKGDLNNYINSVCLSVTGAGPSTSLSCIYPAGPCPSDYTCLGSISSDTNAHTAQCNFYNKNVCCKIELCSQDSVGNTCIQGPTCRTNTTAPNYHNQPNNVVCDNIACTITGCNNCQNQQLCGLQNCNQLDSSYAGCYPNQLTNELEYRDYFDGWSICSNGACTSTTCDDSYNVIDLSNQPDRNNNNIPDLCDANPCGDNTFLASSNLQSTCFCDRGFSDCNGDLNKIPIGNGCETTGSSCPNIPVCIPLPASAELPSTNSCNCPISDPLSQRSLSSSVCTGGQSCCYGKCVDGACDTTNKDFDGDGMSNDCEYKYGLNAYDPFDADHNDDSDQLKNLEECIYGTDPFNPDTDGDGLSDWEEVLPATDTFTSDPFKVDTDNDGLNDFVESQLYNIDPNNTDTDNDGLNDLEEIDTIISWLGLAGEDLKNFVQNTQCEGCLSLEANPDDKKNGPNDDDTDGDGLSDWEEVNLGIDKLITNPFDPTNTCTWRCGEWKPKKCQEGQTQTRTCTPSSSSCSDSGRPIESRTCSSSTITPTGKEVPFFSWFNILITLFVLIGYYIHKISKEEK